MGKPRVRVVWAVAVWGLLAGCSHDADREGSHTAALPSSADVPGWCARVAGGAPGVGDVRVDLSAAHAGIRFFGVHASLADVDQAFAAGLADPSPLSEGHVAAYASRLGEAACARPADPRALPQARVEALGPLALIHPGTGQVILPRGTKAVAVDLRGLPATAGLGAALEAAVAPALAAPVARAASRVRQHYGLTDWYGPDFFDNSIQTLARPPIPAKGAAELPLILLTGGPLPPDAAELAMTLRLANRAWLVGEGVRAEVAEAHWTGVGNAGIAWRAQELFAGDTRWPDEVPADLPTDEPEQTAATTAKRGLPPPIPPNSGARPPLERITTFDVLGPATLGIGEARAALLTAHGVFRRFFPYFPLVGDRIDGRLAETLATVEAVPQLDRRFFRNVLRRFSEAIDDGHANVFDFAPPSRSIGYLGVVVEDIDGEAVVRRSADAAFHPGDTIVRIGGDDARAWYARELYRTSAASDGHRFARATRFYKTMYDLQEFTLRAPDGTLRNVTPTPLTVEGTLAFGEAPTHRPAGRLMDLGAPDLHYINLSYEVLNDIESIRAAIAAAKGSKGLVLDMRHYAYFNHYQIAQHLIRVPFRSPWFNVPVLTGPTQRSIDRVHYDVDPLPDPSYEGPIVLLVGHGTYSAAENFSTMLLDAHRLKAVVGRRSGATNGNITGSGLPGAFGITLTGLEVTHVDGSPFHGIGIVPDDEVRMSAADFRDGRDPELMRAIEVLAAP